jgi:hypothetical protein
VIVSDFGTLIDITVLQIKQITFNHLTKQREEGEQQQSFLR